MVMFVCNGQPGKLNLSVICRTCVEFNDADALHNVIIMSLF